MSWKILMRSALGWAARYRGWCALLFAGLGTFERLEACSVIALLSFCARQEVFPVLNPLANHRSAAQRFQHSNPPSWNSIELHTILKIRGCLHESLVIVPILLFSMPGYIVFVHQSILKAPAQPPPMANNQHRVSVSCQLL